METTLPYRPEIRLNLATLSSVKLAHIICLCDPEVPYRRGFVKAGEICVRMVDRIILRQRAITVLKERLLKKYNQQAIDELFRLDERFARVFCTDHLEIDVPDRQSALPLLS